MQLCTQAECGKLCYYMYSCDVMCYDYNNGHVCEHIHRVHSIIYQKAQESAVPPDVLNNDYHISTSESDSEIETMSKIGITVPASKSISVCG